MNKLKYTKPNYTINETLFEIWPMDEYSRKKILSLIESMNLTYTEFPTTMTTSGIYFGRDDFYQIKKALLNYGKEID